MPIFLTRHSADFLLTNPNLIIDVNRSPYAESFVEYPNKVTALAKAIGEHQFLWAVEAGAGFRTYEEDKPIEWALNIPQERVIGFINEKMWFAFVEGEYAELPPCFSKERKKIPERVSVLLRFPLLPGEVLSKRVVQRTKPINFL